MEYASHERVLLKTHPELNERWLQQRIIEEPTLLGLGDVDVKDSERIQPRAGRLDLLLSDPETNTRFEVEIQLGATDESHIIRTIEYWDIERRRYPQYDHIAVIVAEEITARFFNVISLFNGYIPIMAIQLNAIEIDDTVTLVFTTVLDRMPLGLDEEDEADEPADRPYWERKSTPQMLQFTDQLFDQLIRPLEPEASPKYNKYYIGVARDGIASNFVSFKPRKQFLMVQFKLERSEELNALLEESGLDMLSYDARFKRYRVRLQPNEAEEHLPLLRDLAKQAHEAYGL